jgi:hypothetical protein
MVSHHNREDVRSRPRRLSPTCAQYGHPLSLANVRPLSEEEEAYDPTEAQRAPEGAAQAGPSPTIRTEARTAWRRLTGRAQFAETNWALKGRRIERRSRKLLSTDRTRGAFHP